MTTTGTANVLGVFAHVDTTVRALEDLRAKGYHDLTVYTPIPVHEIEDVLERDRPVSRVRVFTLLGGVVGQTFGLPAVFVFAAAIHGLLLFSRLILNEAFMAEVEEQARANVAAQSVG